MRALKLFGSCVALFVLQGALTQCPAATIYEWSFDGSNLAPVLGPGAMEYADSATPGLTTFGSTDGVTVPHIGDQPGTFMHVPAFTGLRNGYLVTLANSGPNGGGAYINQYSFILDVLLPGTPNWTPFFNTNPLNENDADFYAADDGSVGIGSIYSPPGAIAQNTWNRVAFVADLSIPTLTVYVNGTQVAHGNPADGRDGRWSLFSNVDAGPDLLLFNEGDTSGIYTHEMYVGSVAIVDRNLSAGEISALGGPAAEGIFARRLQISREGDMTTVHWRGAPNLILQKTTNLQTPDWQPITETLGTSTFSEHASGNTFYRLVAQ